MHRCTHSNLVYNSTFTEPVIINHQIKGETSNNSKCWCKKWSFDKNDDKTFEEYLRYQTSIHF